eukprot:SAG31_NODE_2027_length_6639_cov_10.777676_5_plen_102_part_00
MLRMLSTTGKDPRTVLQELMDSSHPPPPLEGLSGQHIEVEAHYHEVAKSQNMYDLESKQSWGYTPEWLSSVGLADGAGASRLFSFRCCPILTLHGWLPCDS